MKTSILVRSFQVAVVLSTLVGAAPAVHADTIGYDPIVEWCNDSVSILDQAEQQAKMVYSMGRTKDAKNILLGALQHASSVAPGFGRGRGPITMRAIQRVTQIATLVDRSISNDLLGDRTSAVFMFRGYNFIRDVAQNLDVPYYVPYTYGRRGGDFDVGAFEEAFVQIAADQLDMVVDSLVLGGGQRGTVPLGTPRAVLKAMEVAAAASAYDLRNSLWAANFACEIQQLSGLSAKLASFNAGNRSLYRSEPEAFYATTAEAKYLVGMISNGLGCAGYSSQYDQNNSYDPNNGYDPNSGYDPYGNGNNNNNGGYNPRRRN